MTTTLHRPTPRPRPGRSRVGDSARRGPGAPPSRLGRPLGPGTGSNPRPAGHRPKRTRLTAAQRRACRRRLLTVVVAVLVAFGALVVKLTQLQAVSPERYAAQAKEQRFRSETLLAPRGAIFDRNGEPLATTIARRTVWADPQLVTDPRGAALVLSSLLDADAESIQRQLVSESRFVYLGRRVDDTVANQVEALRLPGIFTVEEPTRYQPSGELALSVVGFTDVDNRGIAGVERDLDDLLTGIPGEVVQERSRDGHTIPAGEHRVEPATPGSDVVLTIDRSLQYSVERALTEQVRLLEAKAGTAVVMDPRSGEILAMASVRGGEKAGNTEQNLAVTYTYEPGSVMKLVTMSSAIESGLIAADDVRHVPTYVDIYDARFRDDYRREAEDMTVSEIFARSSNVGTIEIAEDLGPQRLAGHLSLFGFGHPTGVGLTQEEPGRVPDIDDWSGTSLPTIAIGQGLSVTPLQLLAAYNVVANGGEYVTPSLVRAVRDPDGEEQRRPPGERRRVVGASTAAALGSMLEAVVDDGTGTRAAVPGYRVAGKTGTAWKVRADGSYGDDGDRDYISTFVGFAPADDPAFSMIVVIDEPRSGLYSGGLAAAPVFSAVARGALRSLDVAPAIVNVAHGAVSVGLRAAPAVAPAPSPAGPTARAPAAGPQGSIPSDASRGGTPGTQAALREPTESPPADRAGSVDG